MGEVTIETFVMIAVAFTGMSAIVLGFLAIAKWDAYCKFTDKIAETIEKYKNRRK